MGLLQESNKITWKLKLKYKNNKLKYNKNKNNKNKQNKPKTKLLWNLNP